MVVVAIVWLCGYLWSLLNKQKFSNFTKRGVAPVQSLCGILVLHKTRKQVQDKVRAIIRQRKREKEEEKEGVQSE